MKKLASTLILGASLALSPLSQAADYVIDTKKAHASINFRVQHLGYSWLQGRFNNFSGNFSFDENAIENSSIDVEINPSSIDSNHAERDKHLRSDDFLDVKKYTQASFKSSSIKEKSDGRLEVNGTLTLRGISKPVTIDAAFVGQGKDPWGGYRAGFTGTTSIALKDYGINFNLGPASEIVHLQLEIEGIKK